MSPRLSGRTVVFTGYTKVLKAIRISCAEAHFRSDQRRQLALAGVLVGALLFSWLILVIDPRCTALIPHEHILIGGAGEADLAAHEQAEQSCGSDLFSSPQTSHAGRQTHQGTVLSIILGDKGSPSFFSSPTMIEAFVQPIQSVPAWGDGLWWRAGLTTLFYDSFSAPPLTPPPVSL